MILTCPNCASRFLLSAQALAPEGRRVKCSSCSEEWFQEPDPDEISDGEEQKIEEIPESVKPVPEDSSLPVIPKAKNQLSAEVRANLAGYAGAFVIFLIILGALVSAKAPMLKAWLPSAAFYEMVGTVAAPGEGLVFDSVSSTYTAENEIIVEGGILNPTDKTLVLPSIEISIRNEAGEEVHKNLSHAPYEDLKAGTSLPFKSVHKVEVEGADHVQVRFSYGKKPKESGEDMNHEEAIHDDAHAKSASKAAGNTPAPHGGGHADPHGDAAH